MFVNKGQDKQILMYLYSEILLSKKVINYWYMQEPAWVSKYLCQLKKAPRQKRMCTVWFYEYKTNLCWQEAFQLLPVGKRGQSRDYKVEGRNFWVRQLRALSCLMWCFSCIYAYYFIHTHTHRPHSKYKTCCLAYIKPYIWYI